MTPLTAGQSDLVGRNLGLACWWLRHECPANLLSFFEPDDALQVAALGLADAARAFAEGRDFAALAKRCMLNKLRQAARSQRGIQIKEDWGIPGYFVPTESRSSFTHDRLRAMRATDHAATGAALERLKAAAGGLPHRQRVIVLGILAGDSGTIVGRRLGLTRSRVNQIRADALAKMRERMGAEWGEMLGE